MRTAPWFQLPAGYVVGYSEEYKRSQGESVLVRAGWRWIRSDGFMSMYFPTPERAVASVHRDAEYQAQIRGDAPVAVEPSTVQLLARY
jgi:hypothetical protein